MPTETFSYTGSEQTWTVPSGVQEITVYVYGAEGQAGQKGDATSTGGEGAYVEGTKSVTEGETLYIYVGGQTGFNGGGAATDLGNALGGSGGGGSDIRRGGNAPSDRFVVAGGGGGGGAVYSNGDPSDTGYGGSGGADIGDDGQDASTSEGTAGGGGGGDQSSGGSAGSSDTELGSSNWDPATSGSSLNGGDGAWGDRDSNAQSSGGGGGGGYYGGGGGGITDYVSGFSRYVGAAGGGAGSNYTSGLDSVAVNQSGGRVGDGLVEIEYTETPAAPNNTSQSVVGDDQIEVTWDEDTSGGTIDGYHVEVSEDGSAYSRIADTTSTSYTHSATQSVNEHRYRVRAYNSGDTSDWTYTATKATDPTALSVSNVAEDQIDLSWTGTDDESHYSVLRAEASGTSVSDYVEVGTPTTTSFSDTGLEDGERYFYRVQSVYSGTNSQLTGEVDRVTPLPSPSNLTLDTTVEDQVALDWTNNDDSSDGTIQVYRSTDGSLGAIVAEFTDLTTASYTDTGLDDGEQYYYTVRRSTDHANADSSQQNGITVLPAPTNLTVDAIFTDQADISWTDNHDYGDTRIDYKPTSATDWSVSGTESIGVGTHSLGGLRNGEEYDVRVVAQTEHTETVDQ